MSSKAFRIFGRTALILSATAATWFPQAALAVSKVKIAGTAKVNITNILSVNLNGTPIVRLEGGSTVALQPGSAVSLQSGTTVGLEPGAAVSLQPGSTVGLQPGSTVSLPVGTKVGLDAATTVKLDPTSTVSVRDAAAREAVQKAFTLSMNTNDNNDAEAFAVPPDKVLVVEYLSCSLRVSSGESLYADLATTVDGVGALHSFFPGPSFQDGGGGGQAFHPIGVHTPLCGSRNRCHAHRPSHVRGFRKRTEFPLLAQRPLRRRHLIGSRLALATPLEARPPAAPARRAG